MADSYSKEKRREYNMMYNKTKVLSAEKINRERSDAEIRKTAEYRYKQEQKRLKKANAEFDKETWRMVKEMSKKYE